MSNAPIGIFDSGVGGLTIWKEIIKRLPNERTIYLADSKNAPYGEKPKEQIIQLSIKNTEYLLEKGCKLIAVACNTATTNAISYLRSHYNVPFIGIEPAIKPAALQTATHAIGILATKGTLTSDLFHKTSKKFASHIHVVEQIGEGLVPLIEEGKIDSTEMKKLLVKYLKPMQDAHIDHLVLGCSHYPHLIPQIRKIIGNEIKIIDSGEAVARQTKVVLEQENLLNTSHSDSTHQLYTNRDLPILKKFVEKKRKHVKVEFLDF